MKTEEKFLSVLPLLFITLFFTGCEEQPEEITFSKIFGGSGSEDGYDVQQTNDGGFILIGSTTSFGMSGRDLWIIKTDKNGNEEWNKIFGGDGEEEGLSIQQTTDGGFIIVGRTNSFGAGEYDIWLIKTDNMGEEEWSASFGGSGLDFGYSVQQTLDGGYILAGHTEISDIDEGDAWLIKTDNNGTQEWSQTYQLLDGEYAQSVRQTSDGGYILTGLAWSWEDVIDSTEGPDYVMTIKTDPNGTEEWHRIYDYLPESIGNDIELTQDGGYIITGYSIGGASTGDRDLLLLKIDVDGSVQWIRTFGGSDNELGNTVLQTDDGGFAVLGYTFSYGFGNSDLWLIKTNDRGLEKWSEAYGGENFDIGRSIRQTKDGGYIIVGTTRSFSNGFSDIWLMKTNSKGKTSS